ncbi:hypothetical protein HDU96_008182 [Phlyctochytrium bullatum]|nr:hypothetical protein HDU96_008182 [Phlyctochytrium bullatum]
MRAPVNIQMASLTGAAVPSSMSSLATPSALQGVKIRDFAYPVTDPRHWGGQGVPLSKAPTKSSLHNLSSSRAQSNSQLSKKDASTKGSQDSKEELEKPSTTDPGVNGVKPADASSNDMDTEEDDDDDANYTMWKDQVSCYLLRAMSLVDEHSTIGSIKLLKKKALYKFSKVTEWEMDLKSSEIVVVAYLTGTFQDLNSPSRRASADKGDASSNQTAGGQGMDRWCSIEDDDDEDLSTLSTAGATGGNTNSHDPISHVPNITLIPDPPSFAEQLKEFIDYQPVYGSGWVTAIKVRVKEDRRGRTQLKMLDIGLVPTGYVGMT